MAVNQLIPKVNSVLGEKMFEDYNKRSENKPTYQLKIFQNGQTKIQYVIRPVLVGNIYY